MKNTIVLVKLVFIIVICSFLGQCKDSGTITIPGPEIKDNIIDIYGLINIKQYYRAGETFSTMGNKLSVKYMDNTYGTITSGFTQEWAESFDWEGLNSDSYSAWYADDSNWAPIRHGDPLPVPPPVSLYPGALPTVFYVRPVYEGMKGSPDYIEVSR